MTRIQRDARLRLADIWDHLNESYRQWQLADEDAERWLSSLLRDLEECRRLCEGLGVRRTHAEMHTLSSGCTTAA